MKVGILAVQGDFEAHQKILAQLGAETAFVKTPADMESLDALVLPGGESTTQLQFLNDEGLFAPIAERGGKTLPIFGTCAGAILLAREVKNPAQASLGLVDMTVVRNAYGPQIASCVTHGVTTISDRPVEMVFIRAPVIERVGPDIEVLARRDDKPILVRQGRILAATFHPELTSDTTIHSYFLQLVRNER
jgi:5'-phosphate synthase pdxT subunit